jgi:hypothetical protein
VSKVCTHKRFLEGADEPFGAAIAFGRTDEGGRAFDAKEFERLLKSVGHVLRSMIMPDGG